MKLTVLFSIIFSTSLASAAIDESTKRTSNFYIAIGVGIIGILIILYLVYAFMKKPSNKWKKPEPTPQKAIQPQSQKKPPKLPPPIRKPLK